MASPPYQGASSPTSASPLALPRSRPNLALPNNVRKPSIVSTTPSNHPLRQTSFPPPDSLEAQHQNAENDVLRYSPSADADDGDSLDDLSDTDITSAISGPISEIPAVRKRKRKPGEKRARGRPPKNAPSRVGSVVQEDARSRNGAGPGSPSVVAGGAGGEGEEDEDDDDDDDAATGGRAANDMLDPAEIERDNQRRYLFREAVSPAHQSRYDAYSKVKLRTQEVRRLINATLSQSVPQNVVTVVGAYTKMFAGLIIESAREVQNEWMAVEAQRPDGEENPALKRLKLMQPRDWDEEEEDGEDETPPDPSDPKEAPKDKPTPNPKHNNTTPPALKTLPPANSPPAQNVSPNASPQDPSAPESKPTDPIKQEPASNPPSPSASSHQQPSPRQQPTPPPSNPPQPGAANLAALLADPDRGPLLPDHLREALRRYRRARHGGSVGFTGYSLEGHANSAPRMGGRRLFQ